MAQESLASGLKGEERRGGERRDERMTHVPEMNGKPKKKPPGAAGKEEQQQPVQPPPPDGGWGWVVVFASFMVHIISEYILVELAVTYWIVNLTFP